MLLTVYFSGSGLNACDRVFCASGCRFDVSGNVIYISGSWFGASGRDLCIWDSKLLSVHSTRLRLNLIKATGSAF